MSSQTKWDSAREFYGKTGAQLRAMAQETIDRQTQREAEDGDSHLGLSAWSNGLSARLYQTQAEIADRGGVATDWGLYTADGIRVRAALKMGEYGEYWAIQDSRGRYVVNVAAHKETKRSKMAQMGLHEEDEMAPSVAMIVGSGTGLAGAMSCRVWTDRLDQGFPVHACPWDMINGQITREAEMEWWMAQERALVAKLQTFPTEMESMAGVWRLHIHSLQIIQKSIRALGGSCLLAGVDIVAAATATQPEPTQPEPTEPEPTGSAMDELDWMEEALEAQIAEREALEAQLTESRAVAGQPSQEEPEGVAVVDSSSMGSEPVLEAPDGSVAVTPIDRAIRYTPIDLAVSNHAMWPALRGMISTFWTQCDPILIGQLLWNVEEDTGADEEALVEIIRAELVDGYISPASDPQELTLINPDDHPQMIHALIQRGKLGSRVLAELEALWAHMASGQPVATVITPRCPKCGVRLSQEIVDYLRSPQGQLGLHSRSPICGQCQSKLYHYEIAGVDLPEPA